MGAADLKQTISIVICYVWDNTSHDVFPCAYRITNGSIEVPKKKQYILGRDRRNQLCEVCLKLVLNIGVSLICWCIA
jgi:hypothetical protein